MQPARRLLQEWPVKKPGGDPEQYVLLVLFNDSVGLFSGKTEKSALKFKKLVALGQIFEISRSATELRISDAKVSFVVIVEDETIDAAINAAWKQAIGLTVRPFDSISRQSHLFYFFFFKKEKQGKK